MAALASLLATLVPQAETVVEDIVKAVKGGATAPNNTSHDAPAPVGGTATAISSDSSFHQSVQKNQPNNAANAAAAAIPKPAVQAGASKVSASNTAATQVSKQLDAVANLLAPCYEAEDALFAIKQVAFKTALDAEDKTGIKILWAVFEANIKKLSATDANSVTDGAVQDDFLKVIGAPASEDFILTDTEVNALGASVSPRVQTAINNLFVLLDAATRDGTVLITRISTGLVQNLQTPPINVAETETQGSSAAV
jgi:hypothetical protein